MAINRTTDNNSGSGTMGQAFERAGVEAGSPQPQRAQPAGKRSIFDLNSRYQSPVSRYRTNEAVQAFVKALQEEFKLSMSEEYQQNFNIDVLDNSTTNMPLSAILITYAVNHERKDHLAVFALAVEGSSLKLNDIQINYGGQQLSIDATAGDVFNAGLRDAIVKYCEGAYGENTIIHRAGEMVLPAELKADDVDHIHRVFHAATTALDTVMSNEVTGTTAVFSAADLTGHVITATVLQEPSKVDTATGLPVRSDLAIVVRGQPQGGQNGMLGERIVNLTRVDGFVDLVWREPQQLQPYQQYGQMPQQSTQRYAPRYVITKADTELDAITPEMALFSLSSAALMAQRMGWSAAFLQRFGGYRLDGKEDLKDIGAIGYEVNLSGDPNALPAKIDTKSSSFSRNDLFDLISRSILDQPMISMDIEETGELTWMHSLFIAAANGSADAYKAIVTAADNLTNGVFGQMWQGGPIAQDDNNRIHLGYYQDGDEVRDLREIDYLAVLNLFGGKDLDVVKDFAATSDNMSVPMEIRLEKKARILKNLLPGVKIKGYARRITFHAKFIITLQAAIHQAGLSVRPENMVMEFGTGQRVAYDATAFGVSGQSIELFNYAQPTSGLRTNLSAPFMGRFG